MELNGAIQGYLSEDQLLSGNNLKNLLENDVQFIWGVFSAVEKGFSKQVTEPPYADGNDKYWQPEPLAPQLADAAFEITFWDSTFIVLIGLPEAKARAFLFAFPESEQLR